MLVYATEDDWKKWKPNTEAPENIGSLLRSASMAVRDATSLDVYETDDTGQPIDPDKAQAMKDATLIQATALNALKIDESLGGVITPTTTSSKSIKGASVSYAATEIQTALDGRMQAAQSLVPDAIQALRLAGLGGNAPWRIG